MGKPDEHEDKPKKKGPAPNKKPLPPKRQRSKLVRRLLIGGPLLVVLVYMGLFSVSERVGADGKPVARGLPWTWTGDDWQAFLSFSREQTAEAGKLAGRKADELGRKAAEAVGLDWEKMSAETRKLWDETGTLKDELGQKLASLKGRDPKAKELSASVSPAHAKGGPKVDEDLRLGYETMSAAIDAYKASKGKPKQLNAAADQFRQAIAHFEKAKVRAKDDAERSEIDRYIEKCGQYLQDCSKVAALH